MNDDSVAEIGTPARREKRDIIGEWPWQLRSIIVVLCCLVAFYLTFTNQAPPKNWFEKFFILPSAGFIFLVHAYSLIAWSSDTVIARFRDEDSTPPELD